MTSIFLNPKDTLLTSLSSLLSQTIPLTPLCYNLVFLLFLWLFHLSLLWGLPLPFLFIF